MKKMKMKLLFRQQFHLKACQYLRILFLPLLFLAGGMQNLSAVNLNNKEIVEQQSTINGIVTASNSEPLFGVLVTVKGTSTKVLTQKDGTFTIKAASPAILTLTLPGYKSIEQQVNDQIFLTIVMTEEYAQKEVKDYFNIYGGKQKMKEATGAFSQLYGETVVNVPIVNNRNKMQGLLSGLFVMQGNGEPGDEGASLWMRGKRTFRSNTPVVLIDGYERSMDLLDPNEIETITVLKDAAATAQYGLRGGNGIVQVTTKRGEESNIKVNFNMNGGIKAPTTKPKLLNSLQYATLYNEALTNDGATPKYSAADLARYTDAVNGIYTDPLDSYLYPNINWYDKYIKEFTWQQRYNLNVNGGNKFAKYFVSAGYTSNSGLYNVDKSVNKYNTNTTMNMITIRSNVDINVSKRFTLSLDLSGRQEQRTYPGSRSDNSLNLFRAFYKTPALAFPILTPDGTLGGTKDYTSNPYGLLNYKGYSLYDVRSMYATLKLKHELDFITKGLSVNGSVAFDSWFDQTTYRDKSFKVYDLRSADGTVKYDAKGKIIYTQTGSDTQMSSGYDYPTTRRIFDGDISLDYVRSFGLHSIVSNAAFSQRTISQEDNGDVPRVYRGWNGRVSYAYNKKYLAEFNVGYQGSEQMPSGQKFGFFPALSAGWVVTEENFLKNNNTVSFLKLRGSYGITGNDDIGGYFLWYQQYGSSGGTNFGYTSQSYSGWNESAFALNNTTWEKVFKADVGIDASFFKDKVGVTFDYFREKNTDIMIQPSLPNIMGIRFPNFPIGKIENNGFDVSLAYTDKIGNLEFTISGQYTKAVNKVLARGEETPKFAYQALTGRPLDPVFGLVALGLFHDQAEIDASPKQTFSSIVQPGDIKYQDQNADGLIDSYDRTYLGNNADPTYQYGGTLNLKFKGFDLNVMVTGQGGGKLYLTGESIWEFHDNGTVRETHLGRFNPADPTTWDNATYPRLSLSNKVNNQQTSTYWGRDAAMVRLKTVELGYTLPQQLVNRIKMDKIRVYLSGYDWFTWSSTDLVDIEARSSHYVVYPIQRIANIGVNITF
jgi:TonB-linked SusC/RagA family outer membrane protein